MLQKIKHLFQRFGVCCRAFPGNCREFGARVALVQFWDVLIPLGKSKMYIETLSRYMIRELEPLVETCNEGGLCAPVPLQKLDKTPVWVCWWQGEEAMPPIVRACVAKLRRSLPENSQLHLITWENFRDYINLPDHVLEKHGKGLITDVHLTDILRYGLMSSYGGAWVDATVRMSDDLQMDLSKLLQKPYYTQAFESWEGCPQEACRGKWCNFFFMGRASNPLFSFVYCALLYWWEHHDRLIDYVIVDYVIWTGYQGVAAIRDMIDAVPPNNENIWLLSKHLNDAYEPEPYSEMMKSNGFFKLSYKGKLELTTPDGRKTVYAHILEENER